jgi:Ca2+-binding RTX toxin-like protein
MRGGAGNDTYYVDSINDSILENLNEGSDIVYSSASFTLAGNLENLTLTGGAAINGTGNSANNVINGNSGNNILNGGTGIDTMVGGAGNDTYFVDSYTYAYNGSLGDVVTESLNAGTDTVIFSASSLYFQLYENVENFRKQGASKISVSGNALNNSITGGIGNDTISGGAGSDTLTGGEGNDVFNFQYANESSSNKKDTITDFKSGIDKISLLFSLSSIATLDAVVIVKSFTGVAGQVTFSSSLLSIDTDGNKSADFQVSLTGVKTLLASDIQVIPLG